MVWSHCRAGKIKCVVVNTGYVESARVGRFILSPMVAFDNAVEAVKHLAQGLYNKWKSNYDCFRLCHGTANYYWRKCSSCGEELRDKPNYIPHIDKFEEWLSDIPGMTIDEYGGDDLSGWWEFTDLSQMLPLMPEDVIEIEHAEPLFAAIVDEKTRESFVKSTHEMNACFGEDKRTFWEILEKEIHQRTI